MGSGGRKKDFNECDCECHSDSNVHHVAPCCHVCRCCGKRIVTVAHEAHEKDCRLKSEWLKNVPVVFCLALVGEFKGIVEDILELPAKQRKKFLDEKIKELVLAIKKASQESGRAAE